MPTISLSEEVQQRGNKKQRLGLKQVKGFSVRQCEWSAIIRASWTPLPVIHLLWLVLIIVMVTISNWIA
jgi:hypothetical protein